MSDLNLGIKIKADGSGLVGELRISKKELDALNRELNETEKEAKDAGRGLSQVGDKAKDAGRSVRGMKQEALNLKTALVGLGLGKLISDATHMTLQLDRSDRALKFAAGSAKAYARDTRFLREESERLGLVYAQQLPLLGKLEAATRGTNLAGKGTRDIYLGVAEAGAVLQLSGEQVTGAMTAIEQIMSKGKVQAEELRGQLGERLPGAFQIAARAMGVSTKQLDKMLERGEVISDDFLPKFAAQLRKEFGPGLAEAMQAPQAEINRTINTINDARQAFGQGFLEGLTDSSKDFRETLQDLIDDGTLAELGEDVGDITRFIADNLDLIDDLVIGYGSYRAAMIVLPPIISAVTGGMAGLNAVMLANPAGLVAVAIASLIGGVAFLRSRTDDLRKAQEENNAQMRLAEKKLGDLTQATNDQAVAERSLYQAKLDNQRLDLERQRDDLLAQKADIPRQTGIAYATLGDQVPFQLFDLKDKEDQIDKDLEQISEKLKQLEEDAKDADAELEKVFTNNKNKDADALEKLEKSLKSVTESLDPFIARYNELHEVTQVLAQSYKEGLIPSVEEYLRLLGLAQEKYFPSSVQFMEEINAQMTDEIRLMGLSETERKIELKSRELMNQAKAKGIQLSDTEIAQIRELAKAHVTATEYLEKRIKAEEEAAEAIRQVWETARENVQESLADTFDELLQGNLDSVGDFWDAFKSIGRRAIAETLAAQVFQGGIFGGDVGLLGGLFPNGGNVTSTTSSSSNVLLGGLGKSIDGLVGAVDRFGLTLGFADPNFVGPPQAGAQTLSLSSALGGSLQGAAYGSIISDILGLDGKAGAVVTGIAAGAPFGVPGMIIGGIAGLIFGGGTPEAGATIEANQYGGASIGRTYSKSGGDEGTANSLANAAIEFYNAIQQIDTNATLNGSLGTVGYRDDQYFFRADGGRRQEFSSAEAAIAAQIEYGRTSGALSLSPIYDQILGASSGQSLDVILENLKFGQTYEDIINATDLNSAEEALKTLQEQFLATANKARSLGLDVEVLGDAFEEQAQKLKDEFEKSIDIGILEFENPLEAELQKLYDAQVDRLEEARTLGADLVEVERLNMLERQAVIEEYSQQANRVIEGYSDDLQNFIDSITYGSSSQLSPQEQIANAEARFNELYTAAQGGDESAISDIVNVAAQLRDLYLGAYASTDDFFSAEGGILASLQNLENQLGISVTDQLDISAPAATIENVFPDLAGGLDQVTDTIAQGNYTMEGLLTEIRDYLAANSSEALYGGTSRNGTYVDLTGGGLQFI